MLTQCPHCLTLFRVGPEHLKAAAGQVRCCRCNQIFNALQSLQESPTPFDNTLPPSGEGQHEDAMASTDDGLDTTTEPTKEVPFDHAETSDWQDFQDQPEINDFEPMLPGQGPTQSPDDFIDDILEKDDGLDPEPDYFASDSESQMSELLDQDSSSLLLPDSEEPNEEQQLNHHNIVDFSAITEKTPDKESPAEELLLEDSILKDDAINDEPGKPDYDSVPAFRVDFESAPEPSSADDDHALNFEAVEVREPRNKLSLYWLVACLLLLLPLAAQLAWQFRDNLIQHTAGRQTLNLICTVAGCEVPARRALDKIVIQGRNLSTHPDKPDTLSLQVSFVNTAAFQQPFPQLTLSLYNDKGNLIARRTFSANDYLPAEYAHQYMMPKAQPILVEMELVDPGKEVTGFSFDFY
jgi:predicted Zn finger-like uncharacterized protein